MIKAEVVIERENLGIEYGKVDRRRVFLMKSKFDGRGGRRAGLARVWSPKRTDNGNSGEVRSRRGVSTGQVKPAPLKLSRE